MKKEDLFEAFGGIDEDLLLRSEKNKAGKKKTIYLKFAGMAACFGVLLTAAWALYHDSGDGGAPIAEPITLMDREKEAAIADNKAAANGAMEEVKEETETELTAEGGMQTGNEADTPGKYRDRDVTDLYNGVQDVLPPSGQEDFTTDTDEVRQKQQSEKKMIDSYPTTEAVIEEDYAVKNGKILRSRDLRLAMEEYEKDVTYRVLIELFRDGVVLPADSTEVSEEMQRLSGLGYIVAYETYNDGYIDHHYFTIHATADQLETFDVDEKFGYALYLYGERVKASTDVVDWNEGANGAME